MLSDSLLRQPGHISLTRHLHLKLSVGIRESTYELRRAVS
jgi:hypothetical protein